MEWGGHISTMTIDVHGVFDLQTRMMSDSSVHKHVVSHVQCNCEIRTYDIWEKDIMLDSLLYVPSSRTWNISARKCGCW